MKSLKTATTSKSPQHLRAPYQYQPILPKSEIRILELHAPNPRDPSGSLHGALFPAKLIGNPSYEAISYVWGQPNFSETLHLQTGTLGITPNLAAALRRFRYPDRTRRLWADAVCINQKYGIEKGYQVQLMGEVFRRAEHVLAWLGEGDKETDAALQFLENLASESWKYGVPAERPHECAAQRSIAYAQFRTPLNGLLSQISANEKSLVRFFTQEWFQRLWIVQEFALAPQFTIYNGIGTLGHETFTKAIASFTVLKGHPHGAARLNQEFSKAIGLVVMRWTEQKFLPTPRLLDLVALTRSKKYSNELDVVYALLGLSRPDDDINVDASYDISLNDLLISITRKYLSKGHLWVLQDAGSGSRESDIRGAKDRSPPPSWVCSFRISGPRMIFSERRKQPNGPRKVFTLLKEELMPLIGIRGSLIDSIEVMIAIPESIFRSLDNTGRPSHILDYFMKIRKLWSQHSKEAPYYTGESEESAFARTLMVDGMLLGPMMDPQDSSPSSLLKGWLDFKQAASRGGAAIDGAIDQIGIERQKLEEYIYALFWVLKGRALMITRSGYIGVGPEGMKTDDAIVTFDGNDGMAFVLRRIGGGVAVESGKSIEDYQEDVAYADIGERWELIGNCYLHGFMDGEAERLEFEDRRQMFFIQ
jgi:hypothetical protein